MTLHIIACQVFYREVSFLASQSSCTTTITWMPQGMHNTPELLQKALQLEIEKLDQAYESGTLRQVPNALVLCYGLCSYGVAGLSSRHFPLALPRTDDCIGIFLGSQQRYLREFEKHPGSLWLTNGWFETDAVPAEKDPAAIRAKYAEEYGEEHAVFLLEQDQAWIFHYHACSYITSPAYRKNASFQERARALAQRNHWDFYTFNGDNSLLFRLLNGEFPEDEILLCPPGAKIFPSFDEKKVCWKAEKA